MLHAVASALAVLQFRAIARAKASRHAALAVNAIAFSALYICGLLILPLLGTVSRTQALADWHIYLATALLFDMATYFIYKSLVHLESATVSVLGTSSALFVVVLGYFFYGEQFSVTQIVGIAVLVPCVWYVIWLAKHGQRFMDFRDASWIKGFIFVLLSSLFLAFAHILEKDILSRSSVATYIAYGWLLQAVFAWVLFYFFGQHAKAIFNRHKIVRSAIQAGALRAATGLFFIQALVLSNNVSLVTVVSNFRIIIVAVLAGWLLGERRFYYKKLAAAAISVVGLSIIFWNG